MGKGMKAGKKKKPSQQQQMAQMQALQRKMDEMQAEIDVMEQSATSGGGAVEVTVNGKKEIVAIKIESEVCDPDDIEMLQDLIMTAANEAMRQMDEIAQNKMNELSSSLGLPPGLI
ncbi:MAG: YbaB/EbfC family nucleoid-associated protein [Anaerovoracaceae bacterium]|jgi:DNA-binding YbaB/EbfC family protein